MKTLHYYKPVVMVLHGYYARMVSDVKFVLVKFKNIFCDLSEAFGGQFVLIDLLVP